MKKIFLLLLLVLTPAISLAQGVGQVVYTLQPQNFFDKVSVLVPSTFFGADKGLVEANYPDEKSYPKVVLTDQTRRPLLALNISQNTGDRESIVKFFRDMKNDLRTQYPNQQFLYSDVIRNRSLAIIEIVLPNKDGKKIYNMMAFRYVGANFFFFNFSCPEEDMPKWQNAAREMAESIKTLGGS